MSFNCVNAAMAANTTTVDDCHIDSGNVLVYFNTWLLEKMLIFVPLEWMHRSGHIVVHIQLSTVPGFRNNKLSSCQEISTFPGNQIFKHTRTCWWIHVTITTCFYVVMPVYITTNDVCHMDSLRCHGMFLNVIHKKILNFPSSLNSSISIHCNSYMAIHCHRLKNTPKCHHIRKFIHHIEPCFYRNRFTIHNIA